MASDFVSNWMAEIDLAFKAKKKFSTMDKWASYRQQYRGDFGEKKVFLNLPYAVGKSLIPRIYFKLPRISVTANRPEYAGHARVVEAIDNWLIQEISLKQALKKAAYDSYCCGTGVLKLGYDSEYGFVPDKADADSDYESVTDFGTKTGRKIEYNNNISSGMPWALRLMPEDVIVPFGYDDPKSLPWCASVHMRPLKDVKEDFKYNSNKGKLKGGYLPRYLEDGLMIRKNDDLYNKAEPYVCLHEIHDASHKKLIVIAEDMLLLDIDDQLQIDGLPYEFIRFNEDMEFFWGLSDIQLLQPQQIEMNDIKGIIAKQRKYGLLKFLYKKGALTQENLDKLLSDDIDDLGCGVEFNEEVESLAMAAMALVPHSLTQELERDKQMVLSDAREVIGLSRNSSGEYIPMTSKTATEAEMVDAGVSVRVDDRRDHMADVLTNIIRKFNQYIFSFWSSEKVIQVTGNDGAKYWVEYTGEQLKGEYILRIDPEAGQPVSRELKYKLTKELFSELRNDPLIDQVGLRRNLLRQYDWLDPEASLLLSSPPPGATGSGGEGGMPGMPGMQGPQNPMNVDQFAKMLGGGR